MTLALTVFQGRAGDHNDRGFAGVEVAEFEGSWTDTGDPGNPQPLLNALSPLVGD